MPAVPTRPLGSTGEQVSCIGVGGAHLGKKDVDEKLAVRMASVTGMLKKLAAHRPAV